MPRDRNTGKADKTAVSAPEEVKLNYEKAIGELGDFYNSLDDRLHTIESKVVPRVSNLEKETQPYQEFRKGAVDAFKQIKAQTTEFKTDKNAQRSTIEELKTKIDGFTAADSGRKEAFEGMQTSLDKLTKTFDKNVEDLYKKIKYLDGQSRKTEVLQSDHAETTALVQLLLKRVQTLETKSGSNTKPVPHKTTQPMTAQQLVEALCERVKNGEVLDQATAARLSLLTAGSGSSNNKDATSDPNRMPYTPLSDSERVAQTVEGAAQESIKKTNAQLAKQSQQEPATELDDSPAQRTRKQADTHDETNQTATPSARSTRSKKRAEPQDEVNQTNQTSTPSERPTRSRKQAENQESMPSEKTTRKRKRDADNDAGAEAEIEAVEAEAGHDQADSSAQPETINKPSEEAPPPRKRGRPRKHPLPPAKQAEASAAAQPEDEEDEEEDGDGDDSPRIRRTARAVKPTPRGEEFVTWLEVKKGKKT